MRSLKLLSLVAVSVLALSSCGQSDADIVPVLDKTIASPVYGMADAPVKLTIFTDFQCPACIYYHDTVEPAVYRDYVDTGKVRVEYRNFPLTIHPNAERDAAAALCAAEQGRYDAYAARLYAWEKSQGGRRTTDADRLELARATDAIDQAQFATCLSESHYLTQVRGEFDAAMKLGLPGTPSFMIDGIPVSVTSSQDVLAALESRTKDIPARSMPAPSAPVETVATGATATGTSATGAVSTGATATGADMSAE